MIRIISIMLITLFSASILAKGVWTVSKGDQHFYLAGSVHLLSAADYPLSDAYLLALKQSDTLLLETDLNQLSSPEGTQQMLALNSYPSGENLLQHLSESLARQLAEYCRQHQLPLEHISRFKPALAAVLLTTFALKAQGATSPGVDTYLLGEAEKSGKKIAGLETTEQHLAVLSELNNSGAETLIKSTLDDLSDSAGAFDSMRLAWRNADLNQLELLYLDDLRKYPAIYQSLIVKRNNAWTKQLMTTYRSRAVFVVVGALHLPGEHGLIAQLKQQGFQVKLVKGTL